MTEHAADVLIEAIERTAAPVCVGIDPVLERLPSAVRGDVHGSVNGRAAGPLSAIRAFSLGVVDAVADAVPCVKFQSACYERYGPDGVRVRDEAVTAARERGLIVVLDAKRGDIGISAEHYAAATGAANWVTINAYLGADGIAPFVTGSRGAFALVRTSNPGGDRLQTAPLADGRQVCDLVAAMVADAGQANVGTRGYSALGAVVGATKPEDAERLRSAMPQQIFLLPGFGAQGAGVDDVRASFDENGFGALVTASRSVIYAAAPAGSDWQGAVAEAARRLADDVGRGVGLR